jgi:hypothetical protein
MYLFPYSEVKVERRALTCTEASDWFLLFSCHHKIVGSYIKDISLTPNLALSLPRYFIDVSTKTEISVSFNYALSC